MSENYETIIYQVAEQIATVTLNRPDRLNTIVPPMPDEVENAIEQATHDPDENMGLSSTQTLGPILDGLMRNTPDALSFIKAAEKDGVHAVLKERDITFGDYSQAPKDQQPNPNHVIHVSEQRD